MFGNMLRSICRTGIFIICAQVLVHFRPKGSYEKYMKMLVSSMILLQLLLPISSLFLGNGEQSLAARVEWFEQQMESGMKRAVEEYSAGEEIRMNMTLEEVRRRMEEAEEMQGAEEAREAGKVGESEEMRRAEAARKTGKIGESEEMQGAEGRQGKSMERETIVQTGAQPRNEEQAGQIEIRNIDKIQIDLQEKQEGSETNGAG